jgi:hypothetical protein
MPRLRRPSAALIISIIALFVATAGSAYAVVQINGATIKKGSIPVDRLRKGQFVPGAILAKTAKLAALATTATNATNATTASGADMLTQVTYVSSAITLPPSGANSVTGTAACPAGLRVISGGFQSDDPVHQNIIDSFPSADRLSWRIEAYNTTGGATTGTVWAVCIKAGSVA